MFFPHMKTAPDSSLCYLRSPETAGDVTRPLPLGLLQLRPCRPSRVDTDATSARAERCHPASAWSSPPVAYHGSPTRFTPVASQVPHHIQDRITDASGSSLAISNVSVRSHRVQLRRRSAATSFHNHQSCCRSTNQDSVRMAGLRFCGPDIWNS